MLIYFTFAKFHETTCIALIFLSINIRYDNGLFCLEVCYSLKSMYQSEEDLYYIEKMVEKYGRV